MHANASQSQKILLAQDMLNNCVILQSTDAAAIEQFEKTRLAQSSMDPFEAEMLSWNSPWRKESLEHYLPTGWCFGIWSDESQTKLVGYFLAQPLMFFDGLTQTFWIEYLTGETTKEIQDLILVATRLAREKHFQKAIFRDNESLHESLVLFKAQPLQLGLVEILTSKMKAL